MKTTGLHLYKRLLRYVRPYWWAFALAVVGVGRFRVERWLADDPYPRAEIVELTEPPVSADTMGAIAS